jgi:hypothetical protein
MKPAFAFFREVEKIGCVASECPTVAESKNCLIKVAFPEKLEETIGSLE